MNKIAVLVFFLCSTSVAHALNMAMIGDAGIKNAATQRLLHSILESEVKYMGLLGDNLYSPALSYEDVWSDWFEQGLQFPVVAIGNHRLSYLHEREYFKMPGEYYSTIVEDGRFIILNSDNPSNVMLQRDFFIQQMELIKNAQKDSVRPVFTFLVFHHPPATLSDRHGWAEKKLFHDTFRPLLIQYKQLIDGIFVSHDHAASFYSFAGIPMIVSGAAYEFFPVNQVENEVVPGVAIKTLWIYKRLPHWVRLQTFPDTREAYIHFINYDFQNGKKDKVVCSILLKSREITLKPNCQE